MSVNIKRDAAVVVFESRDRILVSGPVARMPASEGTTMTKSPPVTIPSRNNEPLDPEPNNKHAP